ncbi:hypothetical protein HY572_04600 [Candidatus Micrarchaeota archaeon]|nr:hypothetical protein [Candidatus Micrarchaeota archaeon]
MNPEQLQRIREHPGAVIVHIGPGSRFPGIREGRVIKAGELHVCIEPDPDQYELIEEMKKAFESIRQHVLVVPKTAQETHFPEGRADEIHIHNVLNQPNIKRRAQQIIALAAKWLKPGGRILVGHTLMPYAAPPEFLEKLAKENQLAMNLLTKDSHAPETFHETGLVIPPPDHRRILEEHMGKEFIDHVHTGYFLAELTKPEKK